MRTHVDNDRYEILDFIASGGQAGVYQARDTRLTHGDDVAIKWYAGSISENQALIDQLSKEGSQIRNLRHHNVCSVYDWGVEEDGAFIILQLASDSLANRLNTDTHLSTDEAVEMGIQICEGLDYIHRTLFHLDLKPGNILLDDNAIPLVTDFGISVDLHTQTHGNAPVGQGTFPYMAPERWEETEVRATADIYSLGITLYEMISGNVPFDVKPGLPWPEASNAFRSLHSSAPVPYFTHTLRVPEEVESVIRKALEKDPGKRYQNAKDLKQALVDAVSPYTNPLASNRATAAQATPAPTGLSDADRIRELVNDHFIVPARENGQTLIEVRVGDVGSLLKMSNRARNVWQSMVGIKFQELAGVEITQVKGIEGSANCWITYRLLHPPRSFTPEMVRLFDRGSSRRVREEYANALLDFSALLRLDPNHAEALWERGACNHELGKYAEAIEDYTKAIELGMNESNIFYCRGLSHAELGDHKQAIEDYSEAIKRDPENADAYADRGLSYYELGEHEKAAADDVEALRIQPDHPRASIHYPEQGGSWSGPIELNGDFISEHGNVSRYRFESAGHRFDLYLPHLLVDASNAEYREASPDKISISLTGSDAPPKNKPNANSKEWEYALYQIHGSSVQYRVIALDYQEIGTTSYSLYIQKSVFDELQAPKSISLKIV